MKKSKIVLIVLILIVAIATILLFLGGNKKTTNNNSKEITIEFDSDGGSEIKSIKTKENTTITLPTTTKEGYNFIGWYQDEKKVTNETKYNSNTKLIAKWDKIPENVKTFTIIFDSKGGNDVNSITLECDKEITFPTNPTKKNNTFINWQDNDGNVITKDTKLSCEDITLTAVWKSDKEDSNSNESNSNSNSNEVTYTCPVGYTMENKNCYKVVDAERKCSNGTIEYNNSCVKIAEKSGIKPTRTCSTKNNVKGIVVQIDEEYYCFYGKVTDADEQLDSNNCISKGHKWDSTNKKCYYDSSSDSNDITYSCNNKNYVYIDNPSQYGVNNVNSACFPIYEKVLYCSEGTLENGKCNITISANEKK